MRVFIETKRGPFGPTIEMSGTGYLLPTFSYWSRDKRESRGQVVIEFLWLNIAILWTRKNKTGGQHD